MFVDVIFVKCFEKIMNGSVLSHFIMVSVTLSEIGIL